MRPTCVDAGPWPCLESGCPGPSVSCEVLSEACGALFDEIWSSALPEPSLKGVAVHEACPVACGTCSQRLSRCELLGREVLVAADAPSETLEVQQLRFALPEGADASGPSAHAKLRAPDAPGQRGRVRAYSMLVDEVSRTFNLTVKIYPGGPPHTRGTSAWLGSLPVGDWALVPQTRRIEWAVPAAQATRVGMVAFGVGIVECLEPLELLLAAGAEVRLVYASRRARDVLYAATLRDLLVRHAPRLSVRHCLSRADAGEVEAEAADVSGEERAGDGRHACPAGERRTRGRLDLATLREEFGAWRHAEEEEGREQAEAEAGAYFLVVGSGRQERDAWGWLRELSELSGAQRTPRRLLAGGRWRELVKYEVG